MLRGSGHRLWAVMAIAVAALGLGLQPGAAAPPPPALTPAPHVAPSVCSLPSSLVSDFASADQQRTFLLRVPPGAGPNTPMVVSMHGATGTADRHQGVTGFTTDQPAPLLWPTAEITTMASLGQAEGFIAVFPQARADRGYVWDASPGGPDVAFVAALTSYLHHAGCSSPPVTSVNGFSMGAMMTSRLMCTRPDLYSGAAMVAGVLNPTPGCALPPDRKILVIHGRGDTVVPFNGSLGPMLEALAGPGSVSNVDRLGIATNWARVKDCPSPGWTTPGINSLTDLTCPRSTTRAVVSENLNHAWDTAGLNTSQLIWAALRPTRPCTYQPPAPSHPAMAAALNRLIASDIAFRVNFGELLQSLMPCNPHVHANVANAIRATIAADPQGQVAGQIGFAMRENARLGLR